MLLYNKNTEELDYKEVDVTLPWGQGYLDTEPAWSHWDSKYNNKETVNLSQMWMLVGDSPLQGSYTWYSTFLTKLLDVHKLSQDETAVKIDL